MVRVSNTIHLPGIPTSAFLMWTTARMTHCCVWGCWVAAALFAANTHMDECVCVCECLSVLSFQFHFSYVVLSSSLSRSDWSAAQRLLLSAHWWVRACSASSCFCLRHLCCLELVFLGNMKGWDRLYLSHTHRNTRWLIRPCRSIAIALLVFMSLSFAWDKWVFELC